MSSQSNSNPKYDAYVRGIAFGLINGIMVTPVMISFCTIIFRDAAYSAYMPSLVKLVLFSSLLHQLSFTIFSSLPFAVGQVQDAGLIFLSAMATSVASTCTGDELVPTALVVLSACTAMLGVMLIVIGKLRLASVVQYLPMPVVGGYLAYIGFFCGQAGLAMMADVQVTSLTQWGLFWDTKALLLLLPGVVAGGTIYFLIVNLTSPYTLPTSMVAILGIFYLTLWATGTSLDEARDYGWISPVSEPVPFYTAWELYDVSKVQWSVFPAQFLPWVGMFFVVAFSSSLDIAAIEMELGLPMDYDRELKTVGISNLVSGLLGGYTGSYIFSQTIFTMRRGVESRVCGYTIVLCELAVMMLPVAITSFIPKFFFGSLLVFIAVDLMLEWLVMARKKMMMAEYVVCLFTFVIIQYAGIELGMMIGIVGAMASFVLSYASLKNVSVTAFRTSPVIRTFEEQAVLASCRGKVITIGLSGFIFFGSAVQLLEEVKKHVIVVDGAEEEASLGGGVEGSSASSSSSRQGRSRSHRSSQRSSSLDQSFPDERTPLVGHVTPPDCRQRPMKIVAGQWASPPVKVPADSESVRSSSVASPASHAGSEASSAPSFSVLHPVYDLSSDQIMRRHEKWKHGSSLPAAEHISTPQRSSRPSASSASSTAHHVHFDIESHPPAAADGGGGAEDGRAFLLESDELTPLSRSDGDGVGDESAGAGGESLLQAIWNTQAFFRRHRMRSNSESLLRSGPSSSNLQVQTFEMGASTQELLPPSGHSAEKSTEGGGAGGGEVRTEFLVLNFTDVSGVDATAARSCFLMLVQLLRGAGATVVFACPRAEIRQLLEAHGVILGSDRVTADLDGALEWCEEQVLFRSRIKSRASYEKEKHSWAFSPAPNRKKDTPSAQDCLGLDASIRPINARDSYYQTAWDERQKNSVELHSPVKVRGRGDEEQLTIDYRETMRVAKSVAVDSRRDNRSRLDFSAFRVLRRVLIDYLEVDAGPNCPEVLKEVLKSHTLALYFTRKTFPPATRVHDISEAATEVFFLERGVVQLFLPQRGGQGGPVPSEGGGGIHSEEEEKFVKVSKVSFGGIFGDVSFFLSNDYSCRALTETECVIWSLDKNHYALMERECPQLCIMVQHVLLKSMSMAQANAMHSTHPFSTYNLLFE